MKLLLLLLFTLPTIAFSQSDFETKKNVHPLAIFTNPEFVGGVKVLDKYISDNFELNKDEYYLNKNKEIIVKFFIDKNGAIQNAKILKGLTPELNKKALAVINSMPNWTAGTQNGIPTKMMYAYSLKIE